MGVRNCDIILQLYSDVPNHINIKYIDIDIDIDIEIEIDIDMDIDMDMSSTNEEQTGPASEYLLPSSVRPRESPVGPACYSCELLSPSLMIASTFKKHHVQLGTPMTPLQEVDESYRQLLYLMMNR